MTDTLNTPAAPPVPEPPASPPPAPSLTWLQWWHSIPVSTLRYDILRRLGVGLLLAVLLANLLSLLGLSWFATGGPMSWQLIAIGAVLFVGGILNS